MNIYTCQREVLKATKNPEWNGFNTELENPLSEQTVPCVVAIRV